MRRKQMKGKRKEETEESSGREDEERKEGRNVVGVEN